MDIIRPRLTIAEYDRRERAARRTACYPAIRAFSPTHFNLNGFPTRVEHEDEIARYADIMGETTPRNALLETMYSQIEAGAMRTISRQVYAISGITPLACLLGPITMWRSIEQIACGRKLTVMDVGAGSGYLCAYLANAGHAVIAVEVTQALYIWQARFFVEWPEIWQMPWWEYAKLFEQRQVQKVDLMVCDAALGEMDPWAMRYTLALAKHIGCPLVYRTVGEPRVTDEYHVLEYAKEVGLATCKVVDPPSLGPLTVHVEHIVDLTHLVESYRFMDFIGIGT